MMIEIIAIAGIGAAAYTVADHENVFGNNPAKQWIWERPPFSPAPPTARIQQNRFFTQPTGEQRVKQAQQALANATREIALGARQQLTETRQPLGQSKYIVNSGGN